MRKILITGAAGNIGVILRDGLKGWAQSIRLNDLAALGTAAEDEEIMLGDLGDMDMVMELVDGVDGIIHLGGFSGETTFDNLLHANIRGTYNIFEAARRHGGKRILFASTNHVTGYFTREDTLNNESLMRPDSLYGVSKCFGENLAQYYHDKFGIESVSVRIGACFPKPKDRRMLHIWLSPSDMINLVKCIFEAPETGAAMVYGTSANKETWWDNSHAAFLGWRPQDSSEQFRAEIEAASPEADKDSDAYIYQGGGFVAAGHFEDD